MTPDTITVHLTRDEIVECIHALDTKIRFNSTEERDINASAIEKLKTAYLEN